MEFWQLTMTANFIVAVAYFGIATIILTNAVFKIKPISLRAALIRNPLAVATGAIFLTCGLGHAEHFLHYFLPIFTTYPEGLAARAIGNEWHMWAIDGITAMVAVWYFILRKRFSTLISGGNLFEDVKRREREALRIHETVIQGLAESKLAMELGQTEQANSAALRALEASRAIFAEMQGSDWSEMKMKPGGLKETQKK